MAGILPLLTGVVILLFMRAGIARSRDPLCPTVIFAPTLFYAFAYSPLVLEYGGNLDRYFPDADKLAYVQLFNLVGVIAFCAGCIWNLRVPRSVAALSELSPYARKRIFDLSLLLGVLGAATFFILLVRAGGLSAAFGSAKGGVRASSGYISELPMLTYSAIILLAISLQGKALRANHMMLALLFASPHLLMAFLGARRGPAFLIMATLAVCYCIVKQRRPNVREVLVSVCILGVLMLFLVGNRKNIYLGSDTGLRGGVVVDRLQADQVNSGHEYVYATGAILTSREFDHHYWGQRYLCILFVRPIPRQLWPTKYEDTGLDWMTGEPGSMGMTQGQWQSAVGFSYLAGSAGGFLADMYIEFSWLGLIPCFLIGWFYSYAWQRWARRDGLWMVIYVILLSLSVYLPTQSVQAWLYRGLILIVPTMIIWHFYVRDALKQSTSRAQALTTPRTSQPTRG